MDEKYLELLDKETRDFIRHTEEFYPADAAEASIDQQRAYYDALCKEFDRGYPDGVSAKDYSISAKQADVPVRHYHPSRNLKDARILYFHGGGFVVGGLDSHDSICAEFCSKTGMEVIAVDYRLAPEHVHPAAYLDCLNVYREFAEDGVHSIILAGDSAGGTLAASVSHIMGKTDFAPIGQLLIYPALGGDKSRGSYLEYRNAPMLTLADIEFYTQVRGGGVDLSNDVTASPLAADSFSHLPPTVIVTAECDPLADDGRDYRDALRSAGVNAEWFNEKGMVHGYLRARANVDRARKSIDRMVISLNMLAERRWDF